MVRTRTYFVVLGLLMAAAFLWHQSADLPEADRARLLRAHQARGWSPPTQAELRDDVVVVVYAAPVAPAEARAFAETRLPIVREALPAYPRLAVSIVGAVPPGLTATQWYGTLRDTAGTQSWVQGLP